MTVSGSETRPNIRPVARPIGAETGRERVERVSVPTQWAPQRAPAQTPAERLLLVAERAVGDLAPTLRTAMLMVVGALLGIALVAAFAGLLAAVLSTLVIVVLALLRR